MQIKYLQVQILENGDITSGGIIIGKINSHIENLLFNEKQIIQNRSDINIDDLRTVVYWIKDGSRIGERYIEELMKGQFNLRSYLRN